MANMSKYITAEAAMLVCVASVFACEYPTELRGVQSASLARCGSLRDTGGQLAKCGVHVPMRHSECGAGGCYAMAPGKFPAIKFAARGKVNTFCTADEPSLIKDQQLVEIALARPKYCRFASNGAHVMDRYATSNVTDMNLFGAGYCHLGAIVDRARLRLARILGPYPLLADVMRFLPLLGERETIYGGLVEVAEGCWHLARSGPKVSNVRESVIGLYVKMLRVVDKNPFARIGADASAWNLVNAIRAVREPVEDPTVAIARSSWVDDMLALVSDTSGSWDRGEPISVVRQEPPEGKQWCDNCGCNVVPLGHADRCKPRTLRTEWPDARIYAIFGDIAVKADVWMMGLAKGIAPSRLGSFVSRVTSNEHMASYMAAIADRSMLVTPAGSSVHSVATSFEASYRGRFRTEFLQSLDWSSVAWH